MQAAGALRRMRPHASTTGPSQTKQNPQLLSHVVWLRGVDWALPRQVVQQRILEALLTSSDDVQHAEAPGFGGTRQQKKHQHHQVANTAEPAGDHKGYALVSFTSPTAAQAAMPILQALPLASGGREVIASLAPAALLPAGFPEHARYTAQQWDARGKREEHLVHRRVKMKRYRERKREEFVEELGLMLQGIPAPGGMHAMEAYQPFTAPAMQPSWAASGPESTAVAQEAKVSTLAVLAAAAAVESVANCGAGASSGVPDASSGVPDASSGVPDASSAPAQAGKSSEAQGAGAGLPATTIELLPASNEESSVSQSASEVVALDDQLHHSATWQGHRGHVIDWSLLPEACQVTVRSLKESGCSCSGSDSEDGPQQPHQQKVPLRVRRKRAQVESFAQALRLLLPPSSGDQESQQGLHHNNTHTHDNTRGHTLIQDSDHNSHTWNHNIVIPYTDHKNVSHTAAHPAQASHLLGPSDIPREQLSTQLSSQPITQPTTQPNTQASTQPSGQPWQAHVVEFGCGSGNLVLPLACLFPQLHFHAVDYKAESVARLLDRACAAGLENLTASVGRIEEYTGPLDVALALHACGAATDYAMLQAQRARAAYVVSPCCIGKLQNLPGSSMQETFPEIQETMASDQLQLASAVDQLQLADGNVEQLASPGERSGVPRSQGVRPARTNLPCDGGVDLATAASIASLLTHPRSRWLHAVLPQPAAQSFQQLAIAADISHGQDHSHEQLARLAKANLELDRNQSMREQGYRTCLTRLLQSELHMYKADLLLGVTEEGLGTRFRWPWGQ